MRFKLLAVSLALGVVSLSGTNQPTNQSVPVEETYVVQPGDTLYNVCMKYRDMDTTDPYILEYMDTIREVNPQLVDSQNQLQIGDKLKMVYYK